MGVVGASGVVHVYVAASLRGLVQEQRAVIEALLLSGQVPTGAGLLGPGVPWGEASSRAWLRRCDLLLVVLGDRDGGRVGSEESAVERELAAAEEAGLPRLTLVLAEGMGAGSGDAVDDDSGARGERLAALRRRLVEEGALEVRSLAELKLGIHEGLLALLDRGVHRWVRDDRQVVDLALAAELAQLSTEARSLRARLGPAVEVRLGEREIAGLSVGQWLRVLNGRRLPEPGGRGENSLYEVFMRHAGALALGVSLGGRPSKLERWIFSEVGGHLVGLGLATLEGGGPRREILLNAAGRALLASVSACADVETREGLEGTEVAEETEETVVATSDSGLRARIQSSGDQEDDEKTNFWSLDPPPETGRSSRKVPPPPRSSTGSSEGDGA